MAQSNALILLQQGIAAARSGNKARARALLLKAMKLTPDNELGWIWLAGVATSPQEAVGYLQRVLKINPANERALMWLERAQMACPAPDWECPLCRTTVPTPVDKCPKCGAVLTLADVDALLNNTAVDRKRIREAIDRYESDSESDADAITHYHLGLAYLNLKRIDKGLKHLQAAMQLRPEDKELQAQVESLLSRQTKTEAAVREKTEREQAVQGTILVVDDSMTVCRLVTITLERHGYRVITAADGLEALAKMSDGLPDLILLDIMMPRLDGYQLCKIIKGNQDTKQIPVVMLSGKDGFFDKVRGRMAGSTEYITKPFEPAALLRTVEKHLGR